MKLLELLTKLESQMELRKEFARRQFAFDVEYPLVNVYIAMDNHHFIAGNIHDFDWAIFYSKLLVIT